MPVLSLNINAASIILFVRYQGIVAKLGKGLHQNVEQDHDYGLEKIECNKITVTDSYVIK
jgi:hypothetical protein